MTTSLGTVAAMFLTCYHVSRVVGGAELCKLEKFQPSMSLITLGYTCAIWVKLVNWIFPQICTVFLLPCSVPQFSVPVSLSFLWLFHFFLFHLSQHVRKVQFATWWPDEPGPFWASEKTDSPLALISIIGAPAKTAKVSHSALGTSMEGISNREELGC